MRESGIRERSDSGEDGRERCCEDTRERERRKRLGERKVIRGRWERRMLRGKKRGGGEGAREKTCWRRKTVERREGMEWVGKRG